MAQFRIKKSRNIDSEKRCGEVRIEYELLSGKLLPGDVFRVYETHHYTNHRISLLMDDHFIADPNFFFDGQYENAVLDTDNLTKSLKHGFDGSGRHLYTPDAIEAAIKDATDNS